MVHHPDSEEHREPRCPVGRYVFRVGTVKEDEQRLRFNLRVRMPPMPEVNPQKVALAPAHSLPSTGHLSS
jgi:hypothetical protein